MADKKEGIVRQGKDPSHGWVKANDDGSEAFVHRSSYPNGSSDVLNGDVLRYEVEIGPKGPRAVNVEVVTRGVTKAPSRPPVTPTGGALAPSASTPTKAKADHIAVSFKSVGEQTENEGLARIPIWVMFLCNGAPVPGLKVKLFRVETKGDMNTQRHQVTQPTKVATTKDQGQAEFALYVPTSMKPPYDLVAVWEGLEYPGSWPIAKTVEPPAQQPVKATAPTEPPKVKKLHLIKEAYTFEIKTTPDTQVVLDATVPIQTQKVPCARDTPWTSRLNFKTDDTGTLLLRVKVKAKSSRGDVFFCAGGHRSIPQYVAHPDPPEKQK